MDLRKDTGAEPMPILTSYSPYSGVLYMAGCLENSNNLFIIAPYSSSE